MRGSGKCVRVCVCVEGGLGGWGDIFVRWEEGREEREKGEGREGEGGREEEEGREE